jgi:hypothetical protein
MSNKDGGISVGSRRHIILTTNPKQRSNPLRYWQTSDALVEYAANFYREKAQFKSVDLETFIKGALYFRDPGAFDSTQSNPDRSAYTATITTNENGFVVSTASAGFPGIHIDRLRLTHIDILSIRIHKQPGRLGKWTSLSRGLRLIQAACACAAVTQGWDQSSMNAANLGWTAENHLNLPINDILKDPLAKNVWLFGLINGAPFFSGSVVGFFFTDPFSNRKIFGRRLVLYIAGIFSFGSVLGSAGVQTWKQLLVCRLLLGIGMGTKACIVCQTFSLIVTHFNSITPQPYMIQKKTPRAT